MRCHVIDTEEIFGFYFFYFVPSEFAVFFPLYLQIPTSFSFTFSFHHSLFSRTYFPSAIFTMNFLDKRVVLFIGVLFHVVFFRSIFDIYFMSPLIHGMKHWKSTEEAPARRLFLMVGELL